MNDQPLDERLMHAAIKHLLPSTIEQYTENNHYGIVSWEQINDELGEWQDREGCTSDYLTELEPFACMAHATLNRYACAAMRLIREMGYHRAVAISGPMKNTYAGPDNCGCETCQS